MRAAILDAIPADDLRIGDVPDPVPGPDEVVLAVAACGICGTDMHILAGESYRPRMPFVMGHEPVGRVVAVGSSAHPQWLGRRVTITLFRGDGSCAWCLNGDERLCPRLISITGVLEAPGGFAERLLVRADQLVPLPDGVDDETGAGLVDAGATAANSVRIALGQGEGLHVVVGGGPVGFLCAGLLRRARAPVVVIEGNDARRRALIDAGFETLAATEDLAEPPAVVVDAAGHPDILPWALSALRPRGLFVAAGYAVVNRVDLAPAARKELSVRGIRSGSREDLLSIIRLVDGGEIPTPTVRSWPLERVNEAFAHLRAGKLAGKAVVIP